MKKTEGDKVKGQFRIYLLWPMYLALIMFVLDIVLFTHNRGSGFIGLAFLLGYVALVLIFLVRKKSLLAKSMVEFAADYSQIQRTLLEDFAVPYGLLDEEGKIIWLNKELKKIVNKEALYKKDIDLVFRDLPEDILEREEDEFNVYIEYKEKDYRVEFKKIYIDSLMENNSLIKINDAPAFMAMYLFDETELLSYIKKIHDEQFVTGLIYIDNYDEALESIDELKRSVLSGLIERKIKKYFTDGKGIVNKLEKDKYLVIIQYSFLEQLIEDKFSILEGVKGTDIGNEMRVTLSIGIATGFVEFSVNYEAARAAIDLALGRGGDQVVLKEGEDTKFYGGKSSTVEKNTRVKARVKAHALRELLEATDNVIVMGHQNSDADSLGAAMGIYRAAKSMNKNANIVLENVSRTLRPILEQFAESPEYREDLFLNRNEAVSSVTENTLLVVVDVNRTNYTECPELVEKCNTIVVIDHHRQSSDTIENAVLSYIEPYASSACEMVAEILQYIGDNVKLKSAEANALYAGIIVDTDNFNSKTGVRTFEAAAFIRRSGADIVKVRKLLRNDMDEYQARAEAVRGAQIYKDCFALAVCPSENLESPTIVGAQAANELLDITGVKASIVFTDYNGTIFLSARSIDEINVQLIMERLGGGGHMSASGAQLKNVTVEQAIEIVKETLDDMIKQGEI